MTRPTFRMETFDGMDETRKRLGMNGVCHTALETVEGGSVLLVYCPHCTPNIWEMKVELCFMTWELLDVFAILPSLKLVKRDQLVTVDLPRLRGKKLNWPLIARDTMRELGRRDPVWGWDDLKGPAHE